MSEKGFLVTLVKAPGPFFLKQNLVFLFHSKGVNSKFQLKRPGRLDVRNNLVSLQLPLFYCVSLIMITITRHVVINIFQMEHFSGIKSALGYKK